MIETIRTVLTLNLTHPCVQCDITDVCQMHRTVLRAFPFAPADARAYYGVLYAVHGDRLIVQSCHAQDWTFLPTGYLRCPPQPQPWQDGYAAGTLLSFRLRANPTRKTNGRRVPVRDRLDWLHRKLHAAGCTVVEADYTPESDTRGGGMCFASVVFTGRAVVGEPLALRDAVIGGIGSGKAFGFGLVEAWQC